MKRTWKPKKINIVGTVGPRTVDAFASGLLAVRPNDEDYDFNFTITHIPSGLRIFPNRNLIASHAGFKTRRAAQTFAEKLLRICDWKTIHHKRNTKARASARERILKILNT